MRRKLFAALIMAIMAGAVLAGCAKNKTGSSDETKGSGTKKQDESRTEEVSDSDTDNANPADLSKTDLGSQSAILGAVAGDWTLFDRESGEDYGILSIDENGRFDFTRLGDKASGSGKISFEYNVADHAMEPDRFDMKFKDVKELLPEGMELYGDEGTSGIFHIGYFGNEDYLYLKEIGNGDSIVSMYVFNTLGEPDKIGEWKYDWLFYREHDTDNTAPVIEDEVFYAWAWETDEDGVWLQAMTEHEYETFDEYSNRKFTGGFFSETDDIGVNHYKLTAASDLSGLVVTKDWDSGYPLMMCEVTVDGNGNIKKLRDVDMAFYNVYDMGDLDPEYSYEGLKFTVNGVDYDMSEYAAAATAITDCTRVGDWIIVDCHVNPNVGVYEFYNICSGDFEYEIAGALLTWQGDDLSTAVYSYYNEIYDFWGNLIGRIQEGELYDLSITGSKTVKATCWMIDAAGNENEFEEEFEFEPCDGAVLLYYEYLFGGYRQWRRLADAADGATALIIIDPPKRILERLPAPVEFEKNALDRVCVISLADDQTVIAQRSDGNGSGKASKSIDSDMYKGRAAVYELTVPEGMPRDEIVVRTPGMPDTIWSVGQLSGRIPMMSTFIKAGK